MIDRLALPPSAVRWVAIGLLAFVLLALLGWWGSYWYRSSDPFVQQALSLERHPEQGREIFQVNCAGCHGVNADGHVGPSLHGVTQRKSDAELIRQVTSGTTPPMPEFQPDPQEMADLLGYLEQL
ncbi:MAG: cytochrome C [Cyanobacteria bacterium QS_8_64_29]|nr:MAG: cytochrome C [Cyanobacteria bacterium QS_8_64_29]